MTCKIAIFALASLGTSLAAAGCSGPAGGSSPTSQIPDATPGPGEFRSDRFFLTVRLPEGWVGVGGPERLSPLHLDGHVAFNSWGGEGFWAPAVESPRGSFSYSPETVMSQMPEGGAYAVLARTTAGPVL